MNFSFYLVTIYIICTFLNICSISQNGDLYVFLFHILSLFLYENKGFSITLPYICFIESYYHMSS